MQSAKELSDEELEGAAGGGHGELACRHVVGKGNTIKSLLTVCLFYHHASHSINHQYLNLNMAQIFSSS